MIRKGELCDGLYVLKAPPPSSLAAVVNNSPNSIVLANNSCNKDILTRSFHGTNTSHTAYSVSTDIWHS